MECSRTGSRTTAPQAVPSRALLRMKPRPSSWACSTSAPGSTRIAVPADRGARSWARVWLASGLRGPSADAEAFSSVCQIASRVHWTLHERPKHIRSRRAGPWLPGEAVQAEQCSALRPGNGRTEHKAGARFAWPGDRRSEDGNPRLQASRLDCGCREHQCHCRERAYAPLVHVGRGVVLRRIPMPGSGSQRSYTKARNTARLHRSASGNVGGKTCVQTPDSFGPE